VFRIQCDCGNEEVFEDGNQLAGGAFIRIYSQRGDMHDFTAVIECTGCGKRMIENQEDED
jgi:hypothetical protein